MMEISLLLHRIEFAFWVRSMLLRHEHWKLRPSLTDITLRGTCNHPEKTSFAVAFQNVWQLYFKMLQHRIPSHHATSYNFLRWLALPVSTSLCTLLGGHSQATAQVSKYVIFHLSLTNSPCNHDVRMHPCAYWLAWREWWYGGVAARCNNHVGK